MARHSIAARIAGAVAATAAAGTIGLIAPPTAVAAPPTVVVASTVVHGIGGPDTTLPVTITTGNTAASIVVDAGGLIDNATCSAPWTATVDFGTLTIENSDPLFPIGDIGMCDLTIPLGSLGASAPASIDVVASERDAFNVELDAATETVTLDGIDVNTTIGPVSLAGGTYVAAEPRSIDDALSRQVTFTLPAARSLTTVAPSGTTITNCPAQAATTVTCDVSRVLSLTDLQNGTAPMVPTLSVDGWIVAMPPADVVVPSERRISIDARATPTTVRVGDVASVDLTIENLGSIDLTNLAVAGGGFTTEPVTCGPDALGAVTLDHGTSISCTIERLVDASDLGAAPVMTVRATAPFGTDSDLVDDDPTSATDIDAVSTNSPFTVIDADVGGTATATPALAFIDDGGVDELALDISVLSDGDLTDVVVVVAVAPAAGVTITGCDRVTGGDCELDVGDLTGGTAGSVSATISVDGTGVPAAGLVDAAITAELTAAGGVTATLSSATISTAGASIALDSAEIDATGPDAVTSLVVTTSPGRDTAVVIGDPNSRGIVISNCSLTDGTTVSAVDVGGDVSLGVLPAASTITCTLSAPTTDVDRTSGSFDVSLTATLGTGGLEVERSVDASVPTRSIAVTDLQTPASPANGFSVDDADGRPNDVEISFTVVVRGGPTPTAEPTFAGDDTYGCVRSEDTDATRFACTGGHRVTQSDLDTGTYNWQFNVSVSGFDSLDAQLDVPIPSAELDVTLTELSTPRSSTGYGPGEEIRLLVQVRNVGTVDTTVEGVSVSAPTVVVRFEDVDPSALGVFTVPDARAGAAQTAADRCTSEVILAPGQTLDCGVVVSIPASQTSGALRVVVSQAGGAVVSANLTVAFDPSAVQPDGGELPATGNATPSLTLAALVSALLGTMFVSVARRRANN